MRYLLQFLIPVLIFVGTVYLLTRQRRRGRRHGAWHADERDDRAPVESSDVGPFLVILALGAAVALGTAFALQSFWQ